MAGVGGVVAVLAPGLAWGQDSTSAYTYATRYDAAGRLTGTIAPDPDDSGYLHYPAVRNSYDAAGRLVTVETGELSGWQGNDKMPSQWSGFTVNNRVNTDYDAIDRKVVQRQSGANGVFALTQYSYNSVGLLECTAVRMNPAAFGAPPSSACDLGSEGSQGPDRVTRNEYDAAGQLLRVIKAYGTSLQQTYSAYEYTPNGKRKAVIDANGNRAEMTYDGYDRQQRWIFPAKDVTKRGQVDVSDYEEYDYDANGNRTSLRKRDGRTISFTYDALNRVTKKDVPDGALARDVYYSYDLRGLQTKACFDAINGSDCVTNVYNGFGAITTTIVAIAGMSRTVGFAYDANGNRTGVTHPDNTNFAYAFDGLDRLKGITQGGTTLLAASYDPRGGLKELDYQGPKTTTTYDAGGRLYTQQLSAPGLLTMLTYNAAGQIATRTLDNSAFAFNGHVNIDRNYAANGLNQYTGSGANSVGYDANGNLTSVTPGSAAETYTYDIENRLVAKNDGSELAYDPLGRLCSIKESGGAELRFLYDGDQLTAEYDASGTLLRRYLHGFGNDDPFLWYEGSGLGDRRILQANHQGSIVAVVSASGSLIQANGYDEYGINNPANQGRFQYTGQAWFNRLGLYHYKARFYSPSMGRFLQTDPIGYDDQINLYAYVGNDPVNGRDPTGMYECAQGNDCTKFESYWQILITACDSCNPKSTKYNSINASLQKIGDPGVKGMMIAEGGVNTSNPSVSATMDGRTSTMTVYTPTLGSGPVDVRWKANRNGYFWCVEKTVW